MVLVDFVDEKDEPIVLVRLLFLKLVKHTNHIRVNNKRCIVIAKYFEWVF